MIILPFAKRKLQQEHLQLQKNMCMPWVVPLPSKSHHQNYYISSRGSQPNPSFATGILGGRTTKIMNGFTMLEQYNMDYHIIMEQY